MNSVGVLIVGAGIGGLTTALQLAERGIRCTVVDAVRQLKPLGVGINLQPHAVGVLHDLGLASELATIGVPTSELRHYDRHGNLIWSQPRGLAAGHPHPQYSLHRGLLQDLLLRAVRDRLGADAVRTGLSYQRREPSPTGIRAILAPREGDSRDLDGGTADSFVTIEADAIIGADGLHSAVRAESHPDEGPPLHNGIHMWRGTAEIQPFLTGRSMFMAGSNSRAKFVAYPISPPNDAGEVVVNWVAEVNQPDGTGAIDWTAAGQLSEVLPHYADWTFDWLDIPALISSSDEILALPMVDRDPLPWWSTDRVTLVGDAAHPMYPIGSNGGSQAILDARALAQHLSDVPDIPTALANYERHRRPETTAVLLANRELGPEAILRTVAERAPNGFDRVEDVLTETEIAEIESAYRHVSAGSTTN